MLLKMDILYSTVVEDTKQVLRFTNWQRSGHVSCKMKYARFLNLCTFAFTDVLVDILGLLWILWIVIDI